MLRLARDAGEGHSFLLVPRMPIIANHSPGKAYRTGEGTSGREVANRPQHFGGFSFRNRHGESYHKYL
jgi:hypothetical protein